MNLSNLIFAYGYIVIFIGSVFEGETVLILGGLAAHENILNMYMIVPVAFFGAITGDWLFFLIGRRYGNAMLNKWPRLEKYSAKSREYINCNTKKIAFSLRFMYGFRSVIPFTLGLSSIKIKQFFLYNGLGAALWALVMGSLGYLAGEMLDAIIGGIKKHEFRIIFITVIVITIVNLISRLIRSIMKKKRMRCE